MTVCRRKETEEPGGCGIRHRRDIATGRVGKKKTLRGGIRRVLVELMVIDIKIEKSRKAEIYGNVCTSLCTFG